MLQTAFNFTIANFENKNSLQTESAENIKKADAIIIREKIAGGIYYAKSCEWWRSLDAITDPIQLLRSKREQEALQLNYRFFSRMGYHIETLPLNEKLYQEFLALYAQTTMQKQRALAVDLEGKLLGNIKIGKEVYLAALTKQQQLESALAFYIEKKDQARVFFGAKKKFNIRGGVGGVLEQELVRFCLEKGLHEINHGAATNPAGIYANAGVFEFKARYGYSAFPTGYWQTMLILNKNVALSDLVFTTTINDQVGYIVLTDKPESEIRKRYLTHEVKHVQIRQLSDYIQTSQTILTDLLNHD